jgi:prepilin-type N-terminal cleavage/methylation domain-containing protein/prepilin-type processing-associated H-X9-DG protein
MSDTTQMRHRADGPTSGGTRRAFTLIELLVVVAIIATLMAILLPSLSKARAQARGTACLHNLHVLGQGLNMYALEHRDVLPPGRLPKVDNENWQTRVYGGMKYRPTFLTMMGTYVGVPAFLDPQPTKVTVDKAGEKGDRQNYDSRVYVCPAVRTWTDERNGCYGYNYQFLGNSRLTDVDDLTSFKNWPVKTTAVKSPGACVAVGDCVGTAAAFPKLDRQPYENNGKGLQQVGNEGFNLDPPRVVPQPTGEMADQDGEAWSSLDDRHVGRSSVLWVDGHATAATLASMGYQVAADGRVNSVAIEGDVGGGNNRFFNIKGENEAWLAAE